MKGLRVMMEIVFRIYRWLFRRNRQKGVGEGISIVIPFRKSKNYPRQALNLDWVKKYWHCKLPGAEIIVEDDPCQHKTFSKSVAINRGVKKSHGDVIVVADADCYIDTDVVLHCATEIRRARADGLKLWFVPYRLFFRLSKAASDRVIDSDPCHPVVFPTPPDPDDIISSEGSGKGHWFGALIQIMPREAFDCFGGWDERFRGWGGEDHSAMRACDTMYWRHKTTPNEVLHLWHPMLGPQGASHGWVDWNKRLWDQQEKSGSNDSLAWRYVDAQGDRKRMLKLIQEDTKQ